MNFAYLASVLMICALALGGEMSEQTKRPIEIAINAKELQLVSDGMKVNIELTNISGNEVSIPMFRGKSPFRVVVSNESGIDVNPTNRGMEKDNNWQIVPLVFKTGEKKIYEISYSKIVDRNGREMAILKGVYTIKAILPIVSDDNRTNLVSSKEVKVTMR